MSLIYLAGAIDKSEEHPFQWAKEITMALRIKKRSERGWTDSFLVYNPFLAFRGSIGPLTQGDAIKLMIANTAMLKQTDLLIVHYEAGQETWGTSQEVLLASNMRIPMLVWADGADSATLPTYLAAHMVKPFPHPFASRWVAAEAAVHFLLEGN